MKTCRHLILLVLLLWTAISHTTTLPDDIRYLYPKPSTRWAPLAATIIVCFASPVQPGDVHFSLEKYGNPVTGEIVYSDDPEVIIFKPSESFSAGDDINVNLSGRTDFSWEFHVISSASESFLDSQILDQSNVPESVIDPYSTVGQVQSFNGVSVPSDFPVITLNTYGETAPGKIFFASTFGNLGGYIFILNEDGSPYFYRKYAWQGDKSMGDFSVQPTGVLTAYSYSDLHYIVLDETYTEIDTIKAGHGYRTDSHELQILENGHALILGTQGQNYIVQELDLNKNVIFEWISLDHYNTWDAIHGSSGDPVHINSIAEDYDGHLIVSARSQGEVSKINRQTGEFIWRLGGVHNEFDFINDPDRFTAQHHVRPVPGHPDRYTVFDNGNYHSPQYSRGVEYKLDTEAMTAEMVWEHVVDEYSSMMGNTQRLPNGNTFIDYSNWAPGHAVEVTPEGDVVMDLEISGLSSYRTRRYEWEGISAIPYLIAESHNNGVALIYNKFSDPDVDHFKIYGGPTPNPTTLITTSTETHAFITTLLDNLNYYFRVTAVSSLGIESGYSNSYMVQTNFFEPGENIVRNGNFSNSRNFWRFEDSGQADARGRVNDDGHYHVDIASGGEDMMEVLLYQESMELLTGRHYRLEFDAYADADRTIEAAVVRNAIPYDNYSQNGPSFLRPFSQHFSYDFEMQHPNDFNTILGFACGGSDVDVYIDNVSLAEVTTAVDDVILMPEDWSLNQNYPNPINPATTIRFTNPMDADILLSVFNVRGQRIHTVLDGLKAAGTYDISVDGSDWPSGLYFYKLETDSFTQIRKMILMK
ncbi:aryl-sulfate sulfotransferase [candidate division KSB1 bacterium]|nr:aryl-sulfate sulfotransferase [candidate division KSB1 bacterium]